MAGSGHHSCMKLSLLVCLAALLGLLAITASAADVNGKWTAQVPGRGGQTREVTFNFKADGDTLTGSMSTPMGDQQISDGKVSGDQISFVMKMNFQGNEVKMNYKGAVSGNEIKFTREVEGRGSSEFTAKRSTT